MFLHEVPLDRSVNIFLVAGWEQSRAIEKATKELVWGRSSCARCVDLVAGEEILPKPLVGSRGGMAGSANGSQCWR